jgi:hypothetical protein
MNRTPHLTRNQRLLLQLVQSRPFRAAWLAQELGCSVIRISQLTDVLVRAGMLWPENGGRSYHVTAAGEALLASRSS